MDPLSLLLGLVAGAILTAFVLPWLLYPPVKGDGCVEKLIAEIENAPQCNGGLTFHRRSEVIGLAPAERTLH